MSLYYLGLSNVKKNLDHCLKHNNILSDLKTSNYKLLARKSIWNLTTIEFRNTMEIHQLSLEILNCLEYRTNAEELKIWLFA